MPRAIEATLAFNRGVLSQLGLARIDLTRYRMAASTMVNWMARVLGSMMLRPGWGYLGSTLGNGRARSIPFVFGASDTAILEVTAGATRVWVDDELVTRAAVGTTVTNGTFATDLSGWTNSSDAGCTVTWMAAGQVNFVGTGTNDATLDQQVSVATPDEETSQALRIIITRGPITLRIGTSEGDDSLVNETILNTGTHSIAFVPGQGSFWIRFFSSSQSATILSTCTVEGAGVLSLPTPWTVADFQNMRWAQSADVIFVGANGVRPMQFERRAVDSWSIVDYLETVPDGPFRNINITNVTLTPSAVTGDIIISASKPVFNAGQLGALFSLISNGQAISSVVAGVSQYSAAILITGGAGQRSFQIVITGTWSGTLSLQYALSADGPWQDQGITYTGNVNESWGDGNANQTIYYRIGFDPGNYTSGSATIQLTFSGGSITGICRITGYTNNMEVDAAVLTALGGTAATDEWYEGAWSTFRGFPGTCALWQGRLWWFGSSLYGSVSDAYNSFDTTITGDSAPIIGQLDEGAVENIYWAIGLQQLVLGTATAETSCRSDYLGDVVTATNFNVMVGSSQGSGNVNALQLDRSGVFVQVTGQRVFSLDLDIYTYSYLSTELTLLVPDFNAAGIIQIAIQRKPDTRLHCVRADGTAGVMVWDPTENVQCWLEVIAANGGIVEDVCVLPAPGLAEDQVYYTVNRTVNGQTVRYREKWAMETECTGLPVAKHLDSHAIYTSSGSPPAQVTTLPQIAPHLVGQTVSVWGWNAVAPYIDGNGNQPGLDLGTYVVAADGSVGPLVFNGSDYAATNAIVGLPYTAQWKSMKKAFAAALGTPLNQPKRIDKLGLILQNTHAQGIQFGNAFTSLDDLLQSQLPVTQSTAEDDPSTPDLNAIMNEFDDQMGSFNDDWSTDSRVCLQAASPRPCTVLAFTVAMTTNG